MEYNINKKDENTFKDVMETITNDLDFVKLILNHNKMVDIQKTYRKEPYEPNILEKRCTSLHELDLQKR